MNAAKIINTLGYIAQKQEGNTINCMKAYKLIWLADRYHLRQYGRTITGDHYCAMPRGIVPSDAKNLVEGKPTRYTATTQDDYDSVQLAADNHSYHFVGNVDTSCLSASDREVLDLIWETYGNMDQWALSDLSHFSPEWLAYEPQMSSPSGKKSHPVNMDFLFENFDDGNGLFLDSKENMHAAKEYYHMYHR